MAEESSLPHQIRTAERSVVFLRQEHLTLLHGLHLEILSLQKRCSGEQDTTAMGNNCHLAESDFFLKKSLLFIEYETLWGDLHTGG